MGGDGGRGEAGAGKKAASKQKRMHGRWHILWWLSIRVC